jgi:phosphoglycolate phosphatase
MTIPAPTFDAAPAAVLFDLDGTLADCFGDIQAAVNHGMRLLGRPEHSLETVRGFVGHGLRRLIERSVGEDSAAADRIENEVRSHYTRHSGEHAYLYDGIAELLRALDAAAIPFGVVSNKPHDLALLTLRDLGVAHLCPVIQGEDSAIARKPAPDMLLSVLGRLGVAASDEVVMVGDGLPDIDSARAAGVRVIAVTWGMCSREDLAAARPDAIAETAIELGGLLHAWPADRAASTSRQRA